MAKKRKLAVVAVGGNALIREKGRESLPDQYAAVCITIPYIVDMIENNWDVIVTHGNGPQVGFILRRSEIAAGEVHSIPLDYGGSNTQGSIGYMFQTALYNEFKRRRLSKQAAAIVTETLVNKNDPAFQSPTKPIGSFMDERTAFQHRDADGWSVMEDAGRGWRRVVASPIPVKILQQDAIMSLVGAGFTVVAIGGGGIPVIENDKGEIEGVEAVIDKDLASALFASSIDADMFLISTEVEKVAINFSKPNVQWLDKLSIEDAKKYLTEGQFGKGSMEPKIKAILSFMENGGRQALVTNPDNMLRALRGETGTHFAKEK